jgi:hypothetical protein
MFFAQTVRHFRKNENRVIKSDFVPLKFILTKSDFSANFWRHIPEATMAFQKFSEMKTHPLGGMSSSCSIIKAKPFRADWEC